MDEFVTTRSAFCGAADVFFLNDTATTEIYTLSLHDALPIFMPPLTTFGHETFTSIAATRRSLPMRSEEHTSELQSHHALVCRLLLATKKISAIYVPAAPSKPRTGHALSSFTRR